MAHPGGLDFADQADAGFHLPPQGGGLLLNRTQECSNILMSTYPTERHQSDTTSIVYSGKDRMRITQDCALLFIL
jgi:hypothetical protein